LETVDSKGDAENNDVKEESNETEQNNEEPQPIRSNT
jgi:hypothetical protein